MTPALATAITLFGMTQRLGNGNGCDVAGEETSVDEVETQALARANEPAGRHEPGGI